MAAEGAVEGREVAEATLEADGENGPVAVREESLRELAAEAVQVLHEALAGEFAEKAGEAAGAQAGACGGFVECMGMVKGRAQLVDAVPHPFAWVVAVEPVGRPRAAKALPAQQFAEELLREAATKEGAAWETGGLFVVDSAHVHVREPGDGPAFEEGMPVDATLPHGVAGDPLDEAQREKVERVSGVFLKAVTACVLEQKDVVFRHRSACPWSVETAFAGKHEEDVRAGGAVALAAQFIRYSAVRDGRNPAVRSGSGLEAGCFHEIIWIP